MQGHHAAAMSHIQSGAKLLCEIAYDRRNGVLQHEVLGSRSEIHSYAPLEVLAPIFARLDPRVTAVRRSSSVILVSTLADVFDVDNPRLQVQAL